MKNLFQQQAELDTKAARGVQFDLEIVLAYIATSSPGNLATLVMACGNRSFALEKQASGMKASNLNEAANFLTAAGLDLSAAARMKNGEPCTCGRCDECVVARAATVR